MRVNVYQQDERLCEAELVSQDKDGFTVIEDKDGGPWYAAYADGYSFGYLPPEKDI